MSKKTRGPRGPYKKRSLVTPAVDHQHNLSSKDNPFEIKTDLELSSSRTNPQIMNALISQIMKLTPGDRRESVNIPLSVSSSRNAASALFLTLRRTMDAGKHHVALTSRGIWDISGKQYLGTRIWRLK